MSKNDMKTFKIFAVKVESLADFEKIGEKKNMFCTNCGAHNDEQANFCEKCGAKLVKRTYAELQENENQTSRNTEPQHEQEDFVRNQAYQQKDAKMKRKKVGKIIPFIVVFVILVAAVLMAGSFALKPKKEKKQYAAALTNGYKYLEEMDYEKAEDAFLEAVSIAPKEAEPYIVLADIYLAQDETETAEKILEQAIENVPEEEVAKVQESETLEENADSSGILNKSITEKLEEIKQLKKFTWVVEPTIEADDIYYLNSNDSMEIPINMLNKQMEENYGYAVIKKGNTYGLIDMAGNLLDEMNFQSVDTMVSRYHVIYKKPHYDSMTGTETTEFILTEDGLSFAFGHGDAFNLYGGIYFWDNGLKQYYFSNEMPEPDSPIAVCKNTEMFPDISLKFNGKSEEFMKNLSGKYAVYSEGKLVTDFVYDECGSYSEGLMAVCQDGKWGYINKNGEIVIPIEYDTSWKEYVPYENYESLEMKDFCYAASDGYVVLCKENRFELRNINGEEVIQPGIFEEIRPVYEGKCWVKQNGKWGVIRLETEADENVEKQGSMDIADDKRDDQ